MNVETLGMTFIGLIVPRETKTDCLKIMIL
jgi:hypothetical protein